MTMTTMMMIEMLINDYNLNYFMIKTLTIIE
jgi:hypothetical protein